MGKIRSGRPWTGVSRSLNLRVNSRPGAARKPSTRRKAGAGDRLKLMPNYALTVGSGGNADETETNVSIVRRNE